MGNPAQPADNHELVSERKRLPPYHSKEKMMLVIPLMVIIILNLYSVCHTYTPRTISLNKEKVQKSSYTSD